MNDRKLAGLLGFAVKARQAAAGADACRILIRSGKCGVLLLDGGASPNTRKQAEESCSRNGTPVIDLPEGMIEQATGRDNMVIGIPKGSFSEGILKIANED